MPWKFCSVNTTVRDATVRNNYYYQMPNGFMKSKKLAFT